MDGTSSTFRPRVSTHIAAMDSRPTGTSTMSNVFIKAVFNEWTWMVNSALRFVKYIFP